MIKIKNFNKKHLAIILIVALFLGYEVIPKVINNWKFKKELNAYVSEELFKENKHFKNYKLDGAKCKNLRITYDNEFDNLSKNEKYNDIFKIMDKFENKRFNLELKYKQVSEDTILFPHIYLKTSKNKYEFSSTDYFTDRDGKVYSDYDFNKKNISSEKITINDKYETAREASENDKGFVWGAAEKVVKENLKSPSTAKFPFSYLNQTIEEIAFNEFKVVSYVEAENGFGANIRQNFSVIIKKTSKNSFTYSELIFY